MKTSGSAKPAPDNSERYVSIHTPGACKSSPSFFKAGSKQTIADYVEAEVLAEEFEARTAVVINEENIATVVAALNNAVRLPRNDDSCHARHAHNPPLAGRKVNE